MNSITGKNVVLIGHSPDLIHKKKNIDKYDTIVRFNFGYPREEWKEFMGTRTDIWFSWDGWDEAYEAIKDKMNAKEHVTWRDYPANLFQELTREQRQCKAPSMGLLAYYYVLKHNPKTVSMYGYDFFRTYDIFTEAPCEHNQINRCHDFIKEEEWFWRTKPDFVKFYDKNNLEVNMNSKNAKRINNKAILEPKEYKAVKTIKCYKCGTEMEYKGYRRGCPECNVING